MKENFLWYNRDRVRKERRPQQVSSYRNLEDTFWDWLLGVVGLNLLSSYLFPWEELTLVSQWVPVEGLGKGNKLGDGG